MLGIKDGAIGVGYRWDIDERYRSVGENVKKEGVEKGGYNKWKWISRDGEGVWEVGSNIK